MSRSGWNKVRAIIDLPSSYLVALIPSGGGEVQLERLLSKVPFYS
jgi:hypothetical protein